MLVIKSAKKKLRQDKKRQLANKKVKNTYKELLKTTRENPTISAVVKTVSSLDKAAKKGIIHPNKAARLKSSLSKLLSSAGTKTISSIKKEKKATPSKHLASKK